MQMARPKNIQIPEQTNESEVDSVAQPKSAMLKLNSMVEKKIPFIFNQTGINLGFGKYGTVELIVKNKELLALKKISKFDIDSNKRIQ